MSGSGGGPPLGVRFVSQPAECDELLFETNLASPVEEVVERLTVGAELEVRLEQEPIPRVVTQFEDNDVGAITERLPDLIRCLQMGATFQASVLTIDDGIVRVEVRPT